MFENKYFNLKELMKGIVIMVLYLILPYIIAIPFIFLSKDQNTLSKTSQALIFTIMDIILIIYYFKDLKKNLKEFKIKDLKPAIIYYIIGLIIMLSSTKILKLLSLTLPNNELANRQIVLEHPYYALITNVLIVPILEELVFRKSFRDISCNKHIYALFTGIIFAYIHVASSLSNPFMILYLIPYGSVAISFCYTYKKTNNIFSTIIMHSIHNLLAIIFILV